MVVQWRGDLKTVTAVVREWQGSEKEGCLTEPSLGGDSCLQVLEVEFSGGDCLAAVACALGGMGTSEVARVQTQDLNKRVRKNFSSLPETYVSTRHHVLPMWEGEQGFPPHHGCSPEGLWWGLAPICWRSAFFLTLAQGIELTGETAGLLFSED